MVQGSYPIDSGAPAGLVDMPIVTAQAIAGAKPRGPGSGRLAGALGLGSLAMICVFQGVQQILVPYQVQHMDAAHKVGDLAILTTVAAGLAIVGSLAGGALSDRTRSRFGRRSPWLIVMATASALLLGAMGVTPSLVLLAIVYAALWFCMNFYQAVLSALVPDRAPEAHRGLVSSAMGLGGAFGLALGVNAIARLGTRQGYWALGVLIFGVTLLCVAIVREWTGTGAREDAPDPVDSPARASWLGMFIAFRSRDFALAFATRLATFTAATTVAGYTYYILQDHVGVATLPQHSVKVAVGVLSGAQTVAWIVGVGGAGWLADRLDRRKLFVGVCSIGMAASMLVPLLSPNWGGFLVFYTLIGFFFGTYLSVDLALMSLVLPSRADEGRDLAVLSVANAAPQLMSPAIAAGIISFAGYDALFWFGCVASLLSGVAVFFIRSVR